MVSKRLLEYSKSTSFSAPRAVLAIWVVDLALIWGSLGSFGTTGYGV